jgi:hypothetical protein
MLEGDLVRVLRESLVPVVLWKVDSHYIHVGPCFVLGLMNSEAKDLIESGKSKYQERRGAADVMQPFQLVSLDFPADYRVVSSTSRQGREGCKARK